MTEAMDQHFGLSDRDLSTIRAIFSKYEDVKRVHIFGSRAKGTENQGSDIDLAVMNDGVKDSTLSQLIEDFSDSSLPYFVDLVSYHQLSNPNFIEHIDRVGVAFYQR